MQKKKEDVKEKFSKILKQVSFYFVVVKKN